MATATAELRLPRDARETASLVEELLTPEAQDFLIRLHREVEPTRHGLLETRRTRWKELREGGTLDFLPDTRSVRESKWTVAPAPADLEVRKVEITGPTDRKMVINALNSGASVYMADFEDANTPTWRNLIEGQRNLIDAIERTIEFRNPDGRQYKLSDKTATLVVRPRGWHLDEKHFLVEGQPIAGALFDFGLYFFHNARALLERGTGPYFYLPKLESHLEARLWNEVFLLAQDELGIPRGTIKATVLIETILATFEMEEILYELRNHSAGLNAGRWDYIFSCIKKLKKNKDFCLAQRGAITMEVPFMRGYALALVQACHKRGAPAMGGMSALIPMIDMLTILVVYLLVHAADYEILPNTRSIQIPQSVSETKPRETVTVLVTKESLFVNGAELASVAELRAAPEPVIEPLRRVLRDEADKRMLKNRDDPTSHEVTVLADKDLPYKFVKKILSTCTAAEYGKVSLAVLERERAYRGTGAV